MEQQNCLDKIANGPTAPKVSNHFFSYYQHRTLRLTSDTAYQIDLETASTLKAHAFEV